MVSEIKKKTINGVLWSAVERFSIQGLQFIIGLVLARLLLPADYGLVGMLAIFLAMSHTFVKSGFSYALIQKKNRNETDFSTAFFFNIGVGILFYFILFFSAQFIASFYKTPELEPLTKVIGINVFISSLSIVQRAKLTIDLDFKTQAKASFISALIGGCVGIYMAYNGYGVWSLVVQSLLRNGINTILLWILSKWVPKAIFSITSFKSLFSFGSKLLGAGLLNTLFNNIYLILIGKLFNARELGFYTRAFHLQQFPSENITNILQRVTFPVLSSMQDDENKLLHAYKNFIKISAFIVFPLMMGLAIIAEPLVQLVLTDKWLPAVPMLQLLCFAGMLYPIHAINLNILNVKGRSDLFLKLEIIKKIIITIAILITFSFGIKALIIGQIATSLIGYFINTYYSGRMINYGTIKQVKDLIPIIMITTAMGLCVVAITHYIEGSLLKLLVGLFTGAFVYYINARIFKFDELKQLMELIPKSTK
jgi:teichuronic acid exporter